MFVALYGKKLCRSNVHGPVQNLMVHKKVLELHEFHYNSMFLKRSFLNAANVKNSCGTNISMYIHNFSFQSSKFLLCATETVLQSDIFSSLKLSNFAGRKIILESTRYDAGSMALYNAVLYPLYLVYFISAILEFERAIFQTFWRLHCCPDFLFIELDTSNFSYLLIF